MRICLDVGGHLGQTLLEVVDPRYAFDKIYCFEPAPSCWPHIENIHDSRIELCRFGLWKETTRKELFGAGGMGASIFPDADAIESGAATATIDLVRATEWVSSHVNPGDVVFLKINCEGAECDVIEDLLDSHLLGSIYSVMIDFDVRKVPSLRWREGVVRRRLRAAGLTNVCFTEDVMVGATHQERIQHWLCSVGAEDKLPLDELRQRHAARLRKLSAQRGYHARLEGLLRRTIFVRLPLPLKKVAKQIWRSVSSLGGIPVRSESKKPADVQGRSPS